MRRQASFFEFITVCFEFRVSSPDLNFDFYPPRRTGLPALGKFVFCDLVPGALYSPGFRPVRAGSAFGL